MQLHVHSQIAHVAKTTTDGKWRAPDSLGYNEHIGAVAAMVSQHLEEALTARFGLEWVARDDGHGFEIKGISGEMMRVFSTRRESITADLRARAARFEEQAPRRTVKGLKNPLTSAPGRIRTRDPLLRRSVCAAGQPARPQVSQPIGLSGSDREFPVLTGRSGTQRARRIRSGP
jgi:hypothetical protein